MPLVDVLEGEVDDNIAVCQEHVVLPDVLKVGLHSGQDIHLSPGLSVDFLGGQRIGGEQAHAAGVPGQVPVLSRAQVV